jgi:hypothetical protein
VGQGAAVVGEVVVGAAVVLELGAVVGAAVVGKAVVGSAVVLELGAAVGAAVVGAAVVLDEGTGVVPDGQLHPQDTPPPELLDPDEEPLEDEEDPPELLVELALALDSLETVPLLMEFVAVVSP